MKKKQQYSQPALAMCGARSLACALALGGMIAPALALDGAAPADVVVVSATRTPQLLKEVAAPVSKIEAAGFAARQSADIGDALQDLPNVDFGGGPRAAGRVPTLRGYSGKKVTVLLDGVRMNAESDMSTPVFIDPWLLSGAEVLRGASSALYGSGGLGGVLSMSTVDALDLLAPGQSSGGDAGAGADSGDAGIALRTRAYGRSGAADALVALSWRDWGAIRQGGGSELAPNDGHAVQGLFKFGYALRPDLRLGLSHRTYRERALRPNNPQADVALAKPGGVPVQRNLSDQAQTSLTLQQTDATGAPALSAQLYRTRLDTAAEANAQQSLAAASSYTDTVGAGVQMTQRFGERRQHRLAWGVDAFRDSQSSLYGGQHNPVTPPGRQTVAGVFVQDEWQIGPVWTLLPALRYDRYRTQVDGNADVDVSHGHLSPKLGVSLRLNPRWLVWSSVAEAYRAPSLNETHMNLRCDACLFNFAPNPALRPETERTLEVGANYEGRGWFLAADRVHLKGSLFYAHVRDLIATAVIGAYARSFPFTGRGLIFQSQNRSEAKRHGIELEASWRAGPWRTELSYSRLRVRAAHTDENLYAPPDKLVANLGWHSGDWQLNWRSRLVAAQSEDSTLERRSAGYATHDVFLRWQPASIRQLEISAGIANLGDKRYVVYGSENPATRTTEMGRALKAGATWTF